MFYHDKMRIRMRMPVTGIPDSPSRESAARRPCWRAVSPTWLSGGEPHVVEWRRDHGRQCQRHIRLACLSASRTAPGALAHAGRRGEPAAMSVPAAVFLLVGCAAVVHAAWNAVARKVKGNVGVLYYGARGLAVALAGVRCTPP